MNNSYEKQNDKNQHSHVLIIASMHKPDLLKNMVEEIASSKTDFDFSQEKIQTGWIAVETSSTEIFVSGDINISTAIERIYISFIANFYFTCTKDKGEPFKLLWDSSLS
jgi:hypothetical protein